MAIIYRTPTEADIPELANLHVLCWQQSYAAILPAEYLKNLSIEQRAEGWCATINDPEVFSLVACEGERIVGFVTAGPARTNLRELQGLGDGEVYAIYNHSDFYRRVLAADFWWKRRDFGCRDMVGHSPYSSWHRMPGLNCFIAHWEERQPMRASSRWLV